MTAQRESGVVPFAGLLCLETRTRTIAFWVATTVIALAVFVPRLPPMVDYPQHLAVAGVLRDLIDPASPRHGAYSVDFFTYNGLFQFLVSRLAVVLPIEVAGKLVVATALAVTAGAALALLNTLRRPPAYAALLLPTLFGFAAGWGFINHMLGVALGLTTLVVACRAMALPSVAGWVTTAVLGLLCGFCHVLATALLCFLLIALAPEVSYRAASEVSGGGIWLRARRALWRAFLALSPMLVGGLYCVAVFFRQYAWDPGSYRASDELAGPTAFARIVHFAGFTTGLMRDGSDQALLMAALAVAAVATAAAVVGRRWDRAGNLPFLGPLVVMTGAYFTVPMVFIGTHEVFARLGQFVVVGLMLALPAAPPPWRRVTAYGFLVIGLLTSANLVRNLMAYARETDAAARLIDELPARRRVSAVVYEPGSAVFSRAVLIHLAGYYGAHQGGEWAFSFARYASIPLYFKAGSQPAWPLRGWEFTPKDYNPRCRYARAFPLVIVAAPAQLAADEDEAAVRRLVFGELATAPEIRRVGHQARFWAFDTRGLADDGTL